MIKTPANHLTTEPIHPASLGKRMLQGAGVALMLIVLFLSGAGEPNPAWGKLWMIKPLMVVPLAGALGALFYYFIDHMRHQGRWKKILANIMSLIVYLFVLWLGTVFGLDGTSWD